MAALSVDVAVPVLIFGELDRIEGEVWLTNTSGGDVTINGATLTVDFPTPETGTIPLADGAAVTPGSTKRLLIRSGMPVYTPGGSYPAHIDLDTTVGAQRIDATVVIADTYVVALAPTVITFTGVTKGATLTASVLVVNKGNTQIVVGPIPEETMLEMVTIPRVVEVSGTTVSVQPGPGLTPGGSVTFTNATHTIAPGSWESVDVKITLPATLTPNRYFRVLPRIATQRFVLDLLT